MEVPRSCIRSFGRHLPRLGVQVWGTRCQEPLAKQCCDSTGQEKSTQAGSEKDGVWMSGGGNGARWSTTVAAAQASPETAPAQPAPPSPQPPQAPPQQGRMPIQRPMGQGPGLRRGPFFRPAMQGPNARRVSAQVIHLQSQMHMMIENGKFREAVKHFEDFINQGFKEAAQQNLKKGQLPLAKRPGEFQWLQYLQALNRSQKIATATISEAMKLMRQVGIMPLARHYSELLYCNRKAGTGRQAVQTVNEMMQLGIKPNSLCYEHAIFACVAGRDVDGMTMLLDYYFRTPNLRLIDVRRGVQLYVKVISACAMMKNIENAMIFIKQMQDMRMRIPIHLYLDVMSHASETDDCVAVDSLLSDLYAKTRVVTKDGKKVAIPIKIDEGVLLNVLNAAARNGEVFLAERAWEMLWLSLKLPYVHEVELKFEDEEEEHPEDNEEEMPQQPAGATVTEEGLTEINAADLFTEQEPQPVDGNWEEILDPILHKDRVPLAVCYHAYIEAQARAGNIEKAFEAVRELEENYPGDPKILSPAQGLSMLADELAKDANTVDAAFTCLDEWHKAGEKVTTPMLDVVVSACSRMGDANRAFETFEAYSQLGVNQGTDSYNALMEVCALQRQVEVIMKLLQEMSKAGVKPNVDTYMQIIEGYINNGDTAGITHALTITRRENFMPTLRVLERAYACAERFNDMQAKQLIRRELMAAGHRFSIQIRGGRGGRGRGGYGRGDYGRGGFGRGGGRMGFQQGGPGGPGGPPYQGGPGGPGGMPPPYQGGPGGPGGMPPPYQGGPGGPGGMPPPYQGGPGGPGGMPPPYQGGPGGPGGMPPPYQGGPGGPGGMPPYQGGPAGYPDQPTPSTSGGPPPPPGQGMGQSFMGNPGTNFMGSPPGGPPPPPPPQQGPPPPYEAPGPGAQNPNPSFPQPPPENPQGEMGGGP